MPSSTSCRHACASTWRGRITSHGRHCARAQTHHASCGSIPEPLGTQPPHACARQSPCAVLVAAHSVFARAVHQLTPRTPSTAGTHTHTRAREQPMHSQSCAHRRTPHTQAPGATRGAQLRHGPAQSCVWTLARQRACPQRSPGSSTTLDNGSSTATLAQRAHTPRSRHCLSGALGWAGVARSRYSGSADPHTSTRHRGARTQHVPCMALVQQPQASPPPRSPADQPAASDAVC
jgi:hypothetical protein